MKKAIIEGLATGAIVGIGSSAMGAGVMVLLASTKNPLVKGITVLGAGISAFCMGYGAGAVVDGVSEALENRGLKEGLDEIEGETT